MSYTVLLSDYHREYFTLRGMKHYRSASAELRTVLDEYIAGNPVYNADGNVIRAAERHANIRSAREKYTKMELSSAHPPLGEREKCKDEAMSCKDEAKKRQNFRILPADYAMESQNRGTAQGNSKKEPRECGESVAFWGIKSRGEVLPSAFPSEELARHIARDIGDGAVVIRVTEAADGSLRERND